MMSKHPFTSPVGDSVPKLDGDIAVGENLDFQRRWWLFERVVWGFFLLLILCDLLGLLGHGWLAKAHATVAGGALSIDYERIERANTPSMMTLHFGPAAIRDGQVEVFVSDSVVQDLGAVRLAPQPAVSTIGDQGIHYRFPATGAPAEVQIQLQPVRPGSHGFRVQTPGAPPIDARILVLP